MYSYILCSFVLTFSTLIVENVVYGEWDDEKSLWVLVASSKERFAIKYKIHILQGIFTVLMAFWI